MAGATEGKVAVVTGASRGIGDAIARRLADEGARVVLASRTLEADPRREGSLAETVADIVAAGGEAIAVRCDLTSQQDRRNLIEETEGRLGPVDILVNNAAVTYMQPFTAFTRKRFDLMVETQLWAPLELMQLVAPGMKERGEGWILNITSRAAVHAPGPPFDAEQRGGLAVYGAVKAGLDRLTNVAAVELSDAGIAVNALAPWDVVATPGTTHHNLVDLPLEGVEWMAEAAVVLCSCSPSQMTGRVVYTKPLLGQLKRTPKPLPEWRTPPRTFVPHH